MTHLKPLTREQVRLLRAADRVCFDSAFRPNEDAEFGLRAIIAANDETGEGERTINIPVTYANVQTYDGSNTDNGPTFCFEMVYVKYDDRHRTWLRDIKEGSTLALNWHRGNNSPILDEAGVCHDMLDLRVQNAKGTVTNVYRISNRVCRDNSARMVRRGNSLSGLDR